MLPIITAIAPIVGRVIEKYVGSKEEAERVKQEVTLELLNNATELQKLQAELVKAEIQGKSWLQRNWRPLLMLCFIAILGNNYILFPYLSAFTDKVKVLEFPAEFWSLLKVGVGGYIGSRFVEKLARRD